jgi:UDP-2,4-diacetamido-2,4,6-trideoxy-beta-L-altropyranose hydrolase
MKVLIRVDGSQQIGSGHVMRCLALADTLRQCGTAVHFVCREMRDHLGELIRSHGFSVTLLTGHSTGAHAAGAADYSGWLGVSWQEDAQQTTEAIVERPDWLVVDHYALDCSWHGRLRAAVGKIMVIDDLADRRQDCDLLLDQNLHDNMQARYQHRVPITCRTLLGPDYALLRREFRLVHVATHPRQGPLRRLLVFMGGSDPSNFTATALAAVAQVTPQPEVEVVVGAQHPALEQISAECAARGYTCHVQVQRMAELMSRADLAIGACGSASWERCCVGLPAIVIAVADNQVAIGQGLHERGACVNLGSSAAVDAAAIAAALRKLHRNPDELRRLSACAYSLVDGLGAERVAASLGIAS